MRYLLLLFIAFFIFASNLHAKTVINEFNPKEEWVELFNTDSSPFNLKDCYLHLHSEDYSGQKIMFSESDEIATYLLIKKGDYNWTSNWIKDDGDSIIFKCEESEDNVDFGENSSSGIRPFEGRSIGRSPDGIGNFTLLENSTEGSANSGPSIPTPTATIKPTATPKPTSTPKPTITKAPSPTIKITATSAEKREESTKDENDIISVNKDESKEEDVLGERTELSPSPTEIVDSKEKANKFPIAAGFFIVSGFVFMGTATYQFLKIRKSKYN